MFLNMGVSLRQSMDNHRWVSWVLVILLTKGSDMGFGFKFRLGLGVCVCGLALNLFGGSEVYLNGKVASVFFNDGDSFRVLSGPLKGTRARLSGFNTLESYGPVHRWGKWTGQELYAFSKKATMNAREGQWHCVSDMNKDIYGRILWRCDDLALSQISQGYAHAMTVDSAPAAELLLKAQREAQKNEG